MPRIDGATGPRSQLCTKIMVRFTLSQPQTLSPGLGNPGARTVILPDIKSRPTDSGYFVKTALFCFLESIIDTRVDGRARTGRVVVAASREV